MHRYSTVEERDVFALSHVFIQFDPRQKEANEAWKSHENFMRSGRIDRACDRREVIYSASGTPLKRYPIHGSVRIYCGSSGLASTFFRRFLTIARK